MRRAPGRHRTTQAKHSKPPSSRKAQAGSARSGGRIVEPPCCSASADEPPKHRTASPPHRQTATQIKILKKTTGGQALRRPALHQTGRTDEAGHDRSRQARPAQAPAATDRNRLASSPRCRPTADRLHPARQATAQLAELRPRLLSTAPLAEPQSRLLGHGPCLPSTSTLTYKSSQGTEIVRSDRLLYSDEKDPQNAQLAVYTVQVSENDHFEVNDERPYLGST